MTENKANGQARLRAIILASMFGSVGGEPLTVGEMEKFMKRYSLLEASQYMIELEVLKLHASGLCVSEKRNHGKRVITRYAITTNGALALVSSIDKLPRGLQKYYEASFNRVIRAAQELVEQYQHQGENSNE